MCIKAICKEFTRLNSNTLSALDLDSPVHRKPDPHHTSTLDALNLELRKVSSYAARDQLNPDNTAIIRALVEPKSVLELNLLGFQALSDSDFEKRTSEAFSYLKTPLEYLVFSRSKLASNHKVSIPRKTREFIRKMLQGFCVENKRRLGSGYSGVVDLVQNEKDYFAVKKLLKNPLKLISVKEKELMHGFFKKEVSLLMSFDHPNIVRVEAVAPDQVFLEWVKDGSLVDVIKSQDLSCKEVRKYVLDIVEALIYVQEKGYNYKDLKPANILISRELMQAKLCDFGFTTPTEGDVFKQGNRAHVAPELHYDTAGSIPPISNKADVWSLGVLMFRMITSDLLPYPLLDGEKPNQYCQRISRDYLNKPCNEKLVFASISSNKTTKKLLEQRDPTGIIRSLIVRCLHGDPTKRISLQDIRSVLSPN